MGNRKCRETIWVVVLLHVSALILAVSMCSAQTQILVSPPGAPHRNDTREVLLFAVENHAASIAHQIGRCRDLLLSASWNTRDRHITYWDSLIRPQVISIRDLLHQILASDDTEAARRIVPDVAALESYTIAAMQLLSSAKTGPDDPSYPLFLAAASQRAEQIVRLIEEFRYSDAAPMDVEAPLQADEPADPSTLVHQVARASFNQEQCTTKLDAQVTEHKRLRAPYFGTMFSQLGDFRDAFRLASPLALESAHTFSMRGTNTLEQTAIRVPLSFLMRFVQSQHPEMVDDLRTW